MKFNAKLFQDPLSRTTKNVLIAIAVVAMALPAAIQYNDSVVNAQIDCTATHNGQQVRLVSSKYAPTPTNATFYYTDSNSWIKETEITNLNCKDQKK